MTTEAKKPTTVKAEATVEQKTLTLVDEVLGEKDALLLGIEATDPTDDEFLSGAAQWVKTNLKAFDDARKALNRPFLDAKAKIDDVFDAPLRALKQIDGAVRKKLSDGQQMKLRAEAQARSLAAESARAGDVQGAVAILQAAPSPAQKPQGVSFIRSWEPTVRDWRLVPVEFLQVNEVALRRHAGTETTPRPVPGVEFTEKLTPRVGGAR